MSRLDSLKDYDDNPLMIRAKESVRVEKLDISLELARKLSSKGNNTVTLKLEAPIETSDKILDKYDIFNMSGSKTYMQLIDMWIDKALEGLAYEATVVTKETRKIVPKYATSTALIKGKETPVLRLNGKFSSVSSLLAHINALLPKYIQNNMGKGKAKSVLNYRTGRFARSAKLFKLDITRTNAIDILYKYMKYPYQTFEPGFAQGRPITRDPRILIQKSIRQIVREAFSKELQVKFTRL